MVGGGERSDDGEESGEEEVGEGDSARLHLRGGKGGGDDFKNLTSIAGEKG